MPAPSKSIRRAACNARQNRAASYASQIAAIETPEAKAARQAEYARTQQIAAIDADIRYCEDQIARADNEAERAYYQAERAAYEADRSAI